MKITMPYEDELLVSVLIRCMLHQNKRWAKYKKGIAKQKYNFHHLRLDCFGVFSAMAASLKGLLSVDELIEGHTLINALIERYLKRHPMPRQMVIMPVAPQSENGRAVDLKQFYKLTLLSDGDLKTGRLTARALKRYKCIYQKLEHWDQCCVNYCPACFKQARSQGNEGYVKRSWQLVRKCPDCGGELKSINTAWLFDVMKDYVMGAVDEDESEMFWYGLPPCKESSDVKIINKNYLKMSKLIEKRLHSVSG